MFYKVCNGIPMESNFVLKIYIVSELFIPFGEISQSFGAKSETDSVPYLIEFTLLFREFLPRKF